MAMGLALEPELHNENMEERPEPNPQPDLGVDLRSSLAEPSLDQLNSSNPQTRDLETLIIVVCYKESVVVCYTNNLPTQ